MALIPVPAEITGSIVTSPFNCTVSLGRRYWTRRTKCACWMTWSGEGTPCRRSSAVHRMQVLTYLRLMRLQEGLVLNFEFETMKAGIDRVVPSLFGNANAPTVKAGALLNP